MTILMVTFVSQQTEVLLQLQPNFIRGLLHQGNNTWIGIFNQFPRSSGSGFQTVVTTTTTTTNNTTNNASTEDDEDLARRLQEEELLDEDDFEVIPRSPPNSVPQHNSSPIHHHRTSEIHRQRRIDPFFDDDTMLNDVKICFTFSF